MVEHSCAAFTPLAFSRYVNVGIPPKTHIYSEKIMEQPTQFRIFYERGDFPIIIEHGVHGRRIKWKVEIKKLDYNYYLPLFFEGISELKYPYEFLARQGVHDLIENGKGKLLNVIPQLIIPIRSALNSHNRKICCTMLKAIQHLILAEETIGEALIPYCRQILPVFNLFVNNNKNCGDEIDYSQRKNENISDLINETLQILERCGGAYAYMNIKCMVPTYESCVFQ